MDWMKDIDWNAIFNWPGISLCVSVISALIAFIVKEVQHKRTARFDLALSKIFAEVQDFVNSAYSFRDAVNSLPLRSLFVKDSKVLDNAVTMPLHELECKSIMTGVFFPSDERAVISSIYDTAKTFYARLHIIFTNRSTDIAQMDAYDKARTDFNNEFDSHMKKLSDILYKRILGKWHPSKGWK